MDVRRIGPADAALWRDAVASILSGEDRDGGLAPQAAIATAAADDRCYLLVALRGDDPIGLLSGYRFPDLVEGGTLVYLYDIEVQATNRRHGVGASLLSALVRHCRADGVTRIWAGTRGDNLPARRAFEATGATLEGDAYVEYEWNLEAG